MLFTSNFFFLFFIFALRRQDRGRICLRRHTAGVLSIVNTGDQDGVAVKQTYGVWLAINFYIRCENWLTTILICDSDRALGLLPALGTLHFHLFSAPLECYLKLCMRYANQFHFGMFCLHCVIGRGAQTLWRFAEIAGPLQTMLFNCALLNSCTEKLCAHYPWVWSLVQSFLCSSETKLKGSGED